jgi:hypothetical protein
VLSIKGSKSFVPTPGQLECEYAIGYYSEWRKFNTRTAGRAHQGNKAARTVFISQPKTFLLSKETGTVLRLIHPPMQEKGDLCMKPITHLHLLQGSECMALYIHSPYAFMKLSLITHSDNCTVYYKVIWYIVNHMNIGGKRLY